MPIAKSSAIYFLLQGLAVSAWWVVLVAFPESRVYFQLGDSEAILLSFWLPDVVLLAFASLFAGVLLLLKSDFAVPCIWLVVGSFSYANLYCFAFALITDTGWLGVTLMTPAMLFSGNFAIGVTPAFQKIMFRRSVDSTTTRILLKTFAQITVVWGLILVILPILIVAVEAKLGIPKFSFPFQTIIVAVAFPFVSLIGLASAYSMAKIGRGTPLPMDTAGKLVVSGIYGYVRNPMAISGIGQGLLVGLLLGSPLVILYALSGGLIWQFIFRRLEEDDMVERFGEDYEEYRRNVRCWIPNFTRFEAGKHTDR